MKKRKREDIILRKGRDNMIEEVDIRKIWRENYLKMKGWKKG